MTVVIVGGGIVGTATAYYLASAGVDAVVCERSTPGAGSTDRAVGGIRAQFGSPANVDLSLRAIPVWESFAEEFGVDIGYRRHGYMFLTGETGVADSFADTVAMQNERGVPSELLDPSEATAYLPELHADRYVAATYSPGDGSADPHLALQGFGAAAREAGAEIRTDTAVEDVTTERGRVTGVETDDGHVGAEYVVNAAGPWAGRVAEMAGIDLPVSPRRRQIAVVEPEVPYPEDAPLTVDMDTGVHFAPDREGDVLLGGHFEGPDPEWDADDYPAGYDLEWVTEAMERATDCAGYFGPESRVKNGWSGLYAVTPDHSPVIEESRPGFVNAVGFSGHGFMHAPATGQVVTDIVREGDTDIVDLSAFASERFAAASAGESHVI